MTSRGKDRAEEEENKKRRRRRKEEIMPGDRPSRSRYHDQSQVGRLRRRRWRWKGRG
jgi:hypothetical protein